MPFENAKTVKKEVEDDVKQNEERIKNPGTATKVKKQEPQSDDDDDDDSMPISNMKSSRLKPSKIKKEVKEEVNDDDDDYKPIFTKTKDLSDRKIKKKKLKEKNDNDAVAKWSDVKKEKNDNDVVAKQSGVKEKNDKDAAAKRSEVKKEKIDNGVVAKQSGVKKERKTYDLPGQRRDPPAERDPLRIFYETLYKQVPNSEMAQFWMMESGLLPKDIARKIFEKKQNQKIVTPGKSIKTEKKPDSAKKQTQSPTVSSLKKKTPVAKADSKPSKKRKIVDGSSEEDSDEDFVTGKLMKKRKTC